MREVHVDYGISPNCVNPDSYGMICVKCGQCGRKPARASDKDRIIIERHFEKP